MTNTMLSRREFLRLAGMTAAGAALSACDRSQAEIPQRSDEKVQLVYQDWRTDWFPSMAQEMLDQFHDTHPNIRVFYTPDPEDVVESVPVAMQAGTAQDVFASC